MKYILNTKVDHIAERIHRKWVSGIGKDALYENVSIGWAIILADTNTSILLGMEKPGFNKGDNIKVTIEKT